MAFTYGFREGLAAPSFGKREQPPALTSYECWAPLVGSSHKAILRAPDSFQARQAFAAAHHGMTVTDVCARALPPR